MPDSSGQRLSPDPRCWPSETRSAEQLCLRAVCSTVSFCGTYWSYSTRPERPLIGWSPKMERFTLRSVPVPTGQLQTAVPTPEPHPSSSDPMLNTWSHACSLEHIRPSETSPKTNPSLSLFRTTRCSNCAVRTTWCHSCIRRRGHRCCPTSRTSWSRRRRTSKRSRKTTMVWLWPDGSSVVLRMRDAFPSVDGSERKSIRDRKANKCLEFVIEFCLSKDTFVWIWSPNTIQNT